MLYLSGRTCLGGVLSPPVSDFRPRPGTLSVRRLVYRVTAEPWRSGRGRVFSGPDWTALWETRVRYGSKVSSRCLLAMCPDRRCDLGRPVGSLTHCDFRHAHSLEDQVKPSSLSEGLEVTVSGDKRYSAVDTALGDERVTKTCLALLCQHLSSQAARALPIARADVNQRQVRQSMRGRRGEFRSLSNSVRTAGAITTWRSPSALVSISTSSPLFPSRNAIHVLVSDAIIYRP